MCEVARHERSVTWQWALWGDNSRRDVTLGVARKTALASSIIFVVEMSWNWNWHAIIVIKTDLSGFDATMYLGLCEQYVKSQGLTTSGFDFLFACALVYCDNKPLQSRFNPLNIHLLRENWGFSFAFVSYSAIPDFSDFPNCLMQNVTTCLLNYSISFRTKSQYS